MQLVHDQGLIAVDMHIIGSAEIGHRALHDSLGRVEEEAHLALLDLHAHHLAGNRRRREELGTVQNHVIALELQAELDRDAQQLGSGEADQVHHGLHRNP